MVLATGNLGERLTSNDHKKNLYISRDGGLNWRSVKPGVFIYEIGDHGALIVIGNKEKPVTEIEFSWDEGETWESMQISESPVFIANIIIEPNSISQQFMVYGTYAEDGLDEDEMTPAKDGRAFLTYLDFSALHEP